MRRFLICFFLVLALGACGGSDDSPAERSDRGAPPSEDRQSSAASAAPLPRVAVYYQAIREGDDLAKFGDVDMVVTVRQPDERVAVEAIHASGAKAYRYVQSYWFPSDRDYDGFDIGQNLDWAYCESGSDPKVGREVNGVPWYFIDANERAAREQFVSLLGELSDYGYDGIMFDRGLAALTGADATNAGIWYRPSTCTDDPVEPGLSLAEAYVGLMSEVHLSGLELFQNYGFSPFHPDFPFRPNPNDPACQPEPYAGDCSIIDDGKQYVDFFLNEAVAHPEDAQWESDYAANLANEQDPDFGGRVVGLITEGTLGGDVSRESVYFQYARVRIFSMPVAVFTGDDKCKGNEGLCNRFGIFEELNSAEFGMPLTDEPESHNCVEESTVNCVWVRQYEQGASVVNVSDQPQTFSLDLAVDGCRVVEDLFQDGSSAGGDCVESISFELPPWSGRPILYADA